MLSDAIAAPGGVKSGPRHMAREKGPQGLNSVLCVRRPVSCLPRPPLLRLLSRVLARACLGGHAQHSAVIRMALPPLSGECGTVEGTLRNRNRRHAADSLSESVFLRHMLG